MPIVSPNDPTATLGKMIADIRVKPSKWKVHLEPSNSSDPVLEVVNMCDLLWKSQHTRHGVPDAEVRTEMTTEEAAAALHLAATLVHWFSSGVVVSVK
jgi:hypothetical protein